MMPRLRAPRVFAAITPDALDALVSMWEAGVPRAFGPMDDDDDEDRRHQPEHQAPYEMRGSVAWVNLHGPLVGQPAPCAFLTGAQTYSGFVAALKAAASDPSTRAIVIDVDSPGGEVTGVSEAAAAVYALRGVVPIVAYVSGDCCSAAYWVASAADRIVTSPTALAGSIGVYVTLYDDSERMADEGVKRIVIRSSQSPRKAAEPDSEESRLTIQEIVDDLAAVFIADVAKHRGIAVDAVLAQYGQGAAMAASRALSAGLIDLIAGPDDAWLPVQETPPVAPSGPTYFAPPRALDSVEPDPAPMPTPEALDVTSTGDGRVSQEERRLADNTVPVAVPPPVIADPSATAGSVAPARESAHASGAPAAAPDVVQISAAEYARLSTDARAGTEALTRIGSLVAENAQLRTIAEATQRQAADSALAIAEMHKREQIATRDAMIDRHAQAGRLTPPERAEYSALADELGIERADRLLSARPAVRPTAASVRGYHGTPAAEEEPRDQQDLGRMASRLKAEGKYPSHGAAIAALSERYPAAASVARIGEV